MRVVFVLNLEERTGAYYMANLLAQYLQAPIVHFMPVRIEGVRNPLKLRVGYCDVYYPVNTFTELLTELETEVVYVFSVSPELLREIGHIKRFAKVIYIASVNPYEIYLEPFLRDNSWQFYEMIRLANRIICFTRNHASLVEKLYNIREISIIPPAIEYKKLASIDRKPLGDIIVMSGRLSAIKNFHTAILAMKDLPESVKLVIYGDGVLRRSLGDLVQYLDLEGRVEFGGNIPHLDMILEIAKSKIFLSTSLSELCSLAELEAMALGVPIVRCRKLDYIECADRIRNVLENYDYHAEKAEEIRRSRDLKDCDVSVVARKYLEIVQEVED